MQTLSNQHFLRRRDLARAVANNHYEFTPNGIAFPRLGLATNGVFITRINDGPRHVHQNIVPLEMRDFILKLIAKNQAPIANWYGAPYTGEVTPAAELTAATFTATMTEFTSYADTTRRQWIAGTVAAGSVDNAASPMLFNCNPGAPTDLQGIALLSNSAKSSVLGTILCCAPFEDGERTVKTGDKLSVEYAITCEDDGA